MLNDRLFMLYDRLYILNNRVYIFKRSWYSIVVYIFLHNHFDSTFSFYIETIEVKDGEKEEAENRRREDKKEEARFNWKIL